jgi:hypothetical protein
MTYAYRQVSHVHIDCIWNEYPPRWADVIHALLLMTATPSVPLSNARKVTCLIIFALSVFVDGKS